jgi:glycosyltransferase involved in cell wall biosynthesis
MACARPVIGASVGGIKYTVRDGKTGLLVPPNDPAALAGRLATCYTTPGLPEQLGRAGLRRVTRRFTWRRVAEALAGVYESVLAPALAGAWAQRSAVPGAWRPADPMLGVAAD